MHTFLSSMRFDQTLLSTISITPIYPSLDACSEIGIVMHYT